jgi:carbonic anhydrase/acetyltransferase-like protein (isoleucine patch superfamily)
MAVYQLGENRPSIDATAFVHPDATIIGDVVIGARASIWPNTTLRGDTETLVIGEESNIQDGTVIHSDLGCPLVIGKGVTVGHQVMLHGCVIGDGSLIGIQSVILNRARIGNNCLVGAGSLITEGKEFPDGVMILGRPARVVRELTQEEIARLAVNCTIYIDRAQQYMNEMKLISP